MTFIEIDKTNILNVLAIHDMLPIHKKTCTEVACFGITVWLDTHNIDFVRRNTMSIGRGILKLYYTIPEPTPQKFSWQAEDFGKSMQVQKGTTIVVEWGSEHPFYLTNEQRWRGSSAVRMGVVVDTIRRTTTFRVPNNYVGRLYYYCFLHENMGLTEIAFAAKPWQPHGIFANTTSSTLLRAGGPVAMQIEGWYDSTMYIAGFDADVQRASYSVLLKAANNTTGAVSDDYYDFMEPENTHEEEEKAHSFAFRPRVRPVLVDTSACEDMSDAVGGTWSAQWPSRILVDRDLVLPPGLCELDKHLHMDYEAFSQASDVLAIHESPQSAYEYEMRQQKSPFTADDVWNDNLVLLPENAQNSRLAIVSCAHTPGDSYNHTMPASTDFAFLLAEDRAANASIRILRCYGTFCMLSIRTAGCVNSQHIQGVWPYTPDNHENMAQHSFMMQGSTAVEIIPFDDFAPSAPQNTDFMGFPAHVMRTRLSFGCADVVLDQPCSPAEMHRHLANYGTFLALSSMDNDDMQISVIAVLDAFENITRVGDVYSISVSTYIFLNTNAVIMNYVRGGTACPMRMQATGHTDTLRDNNVFAKIKCVVCGLNTYYSHQPQPVAVVDRILDFYVASFDHVEYEISDVEENGNYFGREVPTRSYFMTPDRSAAFTSVRQLHTDEVVIETGTTLVVHSAHSLVFMCGGAEIRVPRHNATSVRLYVASEYSGQAIFVHVLDHAAPNDTLVRPGVLFPRARMQEATCLACPAGKFSGEHAAPDVSKCLDVQVPPALRETSTLPAETRVHTEMPIMTYMQVEGEFMSVLALRHTEKHIASSEFAFAVMLGTADIDLVHRHAAFIETRIFLLYHAQASALAGRMYSTHLNITLHSLTNVVLFRLEGSYNVELDTTNTSPPVPPPLPTPVLPLPPPPSPFVTTMAVSMPISMAEFDNGKQTVFKAAVAVTAGVSPSDVGISNITSIATGGSRRLLAVGTRVDFRVSAATQSASAHLENRLGSAAALNANLQLAGLPQATVLVMPKTTQGQPVIVTTVQASYENSTLDTWDWWVDGVVIGFVLLLIMTGVAACVYIRQINTYTRLGMQIETPTATPVASTYHQNHDTAPPYYDTPPSAPPYHDNSPSAPPYYK